SEGAHAAEFWSSQLAFRRGPRKRGTPNITICSFELDSRLAVKHDIHHADGTAEEHSGFYSARATRERHDAKHARNPKSFRVRQPNISDAVHRGARAKGLSRSACPQSTRADYSSYEGQDYRYSDLWADPGWDVCVD